MCWGVPKLKVIFSRAEWEEKGGADVEKEKFERFLENRGRWEEKKGFLGKF